MTWTLGVNIVGRRVLEMGFLWYAGGSSAGIRAWTLRLSRRDHAAAPVWVPRASRAVEAAMLRGTSKPKGESIEGSALP